MDKGKQREYGSISREELMDSQPSSENRMWKESIHLGDTVELCGLEFEIIRVKELRGEVHLKLKR